MSVDELLNIFDENEDILELLKTQIEGKFLSNEVHPIIHSIRNRKKKRTHLREKLIRKQTDGRIINQDNFFNEITDLVGIRILLLCPKHFQNINEFILKIAENNDWILHEDPIAYTWDPEMQTFFKDKLGIKEENIKQKESYYTSLHYVVKPNINSPCCEIQVRTLMEEVWGEIDHKFNYPEKHSNKHLQDNLKALAKLVASGTKLTEIIYNLGEH